MLSQFLTFTLAFKTEAGVLVPIFWITGVLTADGVAIVSVSATGTLVPDLGVPMVVPLVREVLGSLPEELVGSLSSEGGKITKYAFSFSNV